MKRKRKDEDSDQSTKKQKIDHIEIESFPEHDFHNISFFSCKIPDKNRTKFKVRDDEAKKISGKDDFFRYKGAKTGGLQSRYAIGELDVKSKKLSVVPMDRYFRIDRHYKSEKKNIDEVKIEEFQTSQHRRVQEKRKKMMSRKDEFDYEITRSESVSLERDYLPPIKENAKKVSRIYHWKKMIPRRERALIPTQFTLLSQEVPGVINHYFSEGEITEKKNVTILNYFKYLCYFIHLKKRFKKRFFRYSVYFNDLNPLKVEDEELWKKLLDKFTNSVKNTYNISDIHKKKIVCFSIALLMHLEDFVLDDAYLRLLTVDMNVSFQELLSSAKSMGCKVKKKEKGKFSVSLKIPFKLPSFRELERNRSRKRR